MDSQGRRILSLVALLCLMAPPRARAQKVHERFSFGGFASTERFQDASGGSDSNDFAVASARAFLMVQDWGRGKWELISDLRDKHDFFDKLDSERLQLTDRNEFQLRQMSLRRANPRLFWNPQFGRFPIPEAGSAFTDGAQIAMNFSPSLTASFFGGLNPKQEAQSYLAFDPDSQVYGATLRYQSAARSWTRNFYTAHSYVEKVYAGHLDRRYIFHNMSYQWRPTSRLLTLAYLDLVPRTYVQTANLIWQQGFSRYFSTELAGLSMDSIEYSRRAGVLEKLPSSPYREGRLKLNLRSSARTRFFHDSIYGKREVDKKERIEEHLGVFRTGIFSKNWDGHALLGWRRNFTSLDYLARAGLGYFSRSWESTLDVDYATQKYDEGKTLNPLIAEISLSHYHSRNLYSTISVQHAADEEKRILSVFFKLGLQLGNQEVAPVRDGAPPRGRL
ncbi:MAG: hypothetical protein AB7F86_10430 [Bdellovibrionales bacterium]